MRKLPGDFVSEGEELATLVNQDVELQYLTAKGRYETQTAAGRIDSVEFDRQRPKPPMSCRRNGRCSKICNINCKHVKLAGRFGDSRTGRRPADRSTAAIRRDKNSRIVWSVGPDTRPKRENQDCFLEPGQELMSIAEDGSLGCGVDFESIRSPSCEGRIGREVGA